jgi:hypothetical protein
MGRDGALIVGLVQLAAIARVAAPLVDGGASAASFAVAGLSLAAAFAVWLVRLAPLVRLGGAH